MSLVLNRLARVSLLGATVHLFVASLVWAGNPYSAIELRAVESSDEAKIRDLRNQEMTQLRITLGRRGPSNRRAELYFRVAELHLEAYRAAFLLEGRAHEKRIAEGVRDSFIDRTHSKPFLSSGIQACQEILRFKIPFNKMDEVYYFLGFYYGEKDDRDASAKYFSILIQQYPKSPFSGPAAKEVGEYYFRKSDFHKALSYLETALRTARPEFGPPILHKMAWSCYRTRQYDRAISVMKRAIAACSEHGDRFLPLKDEALRDMAVLMTERGQVKEVVQYFQEVSNDPKLLPKILEKLGNQYEHNVERAKAVAVYDILLKTYPGSVAAFRVLIKWTEVEIKQGHFTAVLTRLRGYSFLDPETFEGSDSDKTEIRDLAQNLRVLVRKTATDHHQAYRKKKVRSDLEIAEMFYEAYLNLFLKKQDPHMETVEIQMYLAEIKRDLGKSGEAVVLYRDILKAPQNSKAPKAKEFAKEAGFLWMASLSEAIKKQAHGTTGEPSPLEKEFVEASDLVQASQLASGNVNGAQETVLRATQVLAGYASTREAAIQRILLILEQWPKSRQALTAAQLWIQLRKEMDHGVDGVELVSVYKILRENAALMTTDQTLNHGRIKAAIEEDDRRARVSTIGKYEREKDFVTAAKAYEEFAASEKSQDISEKAYVNAVGSYLKARSLEPILPLIDVWTRRFPKSHSRADSLRAVATHALIAGNYELSAQIFNKLGTEYGLSESLETAARLYQGLGLSAQAHQSWNRYLSLYPSSPQRWRVLLALAKSQELANQDSEASRSYRACAQGPEDIQSECNSRLADLYFRNKDIAQARNLYERVAQVKSTKSKSKKATQDASPYTGYARFRLAEMKEGEPQFDVMALPEARLQKALGQRLNFLEPLSKSYQNVMQAGGPWGIAALHRLAIFVMKFAEEVDAIAPSPTAKPAGVEKFKANLKTVSGPLREKAKGAWNEAYTRAISVELLSPYLPLIADHLADFKVPVPARAQGPRGQFTIVGIPANGGSDGLAVSFQKVRERLLARGVDRNQEAEAWIDYGNLLWGEGKPLMAKLAYERSLALKPKNSHALNNLAIVQILSEGEEDWMGVNEAAHLLGEALHGDDFFVAAKMNLASLMNYYRNFSRAKTLWEQVLVRHKGVIAWEGLGIALQGLGKIKEAEAAFKSAAQVGGALTPFVETYHEAARYSFQGVDGAEKCLSRLEEIETSKLMGFEKSSVDYLKDTCKRWQKKI